MKIQIKNKQTKVKVEKRRIRKTVSRLFEILCCQDKEISVFFTDDDHIKKLNNDYLGRNKSTNVLSFSLQEGEYGEINPHIMGDIVISVDTAKKDASKGHLTLEQEIDFLLIHGMLHLLGYNHEDTSRKQAREMRKKERELFNIIHCRHKRLI